MALIVEQYSALGKDTNGNSLQVPDAQTFLGAVAEGVAFHSMASYIVVTSDIDDLIAIGPDGAEGVPAIPVTAGVPRPFTVPRGQGWAAAI